MIQGGQRSLPPDRDLRVPPDYWLDKEHQWSNKKIVVQVKAVGFFGLLAIGFIVLKLSQVIQWSWVWVLAPLWIPPATVILGATGFLGLLLIVALFATGGQRKRRKK